ncbi:hypothetical protein O6H91_04G041600 [Diphasiastrum complanatum]|uniref:Uncharacterized protein n=1 Tax=Diphasiastrum complanatum TaxID=34168 RepID=A0ACC2DWU8_DIPCM|nr:hypothetical protein O6H91_04G041600 [Diphasiastrum complanatum]
MLLLLVASDFGCGFLVAVSQGVVIRVCSATVAAQSSWISREQSFSHGSAGIPVSLLSVFHRLHVCLREGSSLGSLDVVMITMPSKVIPHLISCSGAATYTPAAAVLGITYFWITNTRLQLLCFLAAAHRQSKRLYDTVVPPGTDPAFDRGQGSSHRQVMRRKIHRW